MRKIIFLVFVIFIACNSNKKDKQLPFYEIYKYDNEFSLRQDKIEFLDSMLENYPYSDYLHGLKIMAIAKQGKANEAIDYSNHIVVNLDVYDHYLITGRAFARMKLYGLKGVPFDTNVTYTAKDSALVKLLMKTYTHVQDSSFSEMLKYISGTDRGQYLPTYTKEFLEAYQNDRQKINLWVRLGLAKIYAAFFQVDKATRYYREAYEVNPDNADLLLAYSEFQTRIHQNYEFAKELLDKIPASYNRDSVEALKQIIEDSTNEILIP